VAKNRSNSAIGTRMEYPDRWSNVKTKVYLILPYKIMLNNIVLCYWESIQITQMNGCSIHS